MSMWLDGNAGGFTDAGFFIPGVVGADSYTSGVILQPAMSPFAAQAGVFEIILYIGNRASTKTSPTPSDQLLRVFLT